MVAFRHLATWILNKNMLNAGPSTVNIVDSPKFATNLDSRILFSSRNRYQYLFLRMRDRGDMQMNVYSIGTIEDLWKIMRFKQVKSVN